MPIQQITSGIISDNAVVVADIADSTITGAKLAANTLANSVFQTGSVENYMRAQGVTSSFAGMRNRIINGAMVIDQRNAGANTLLGLGSTITLDRWTTYSALASKISIQQDSSSNTVAGFTSSLKVTSLAATTPGTEDVYVVRQYIEGYNVADLAFGTANAKTFTLSFWVRSSLTGTFGGAFKNSAGDYSYPFTYTISSANTWEQKIITVPGSTSGTWLTTNGLGLSLVFSLGSGSSYTGTAGSWSNNSYFTATGSTNFVGTNGATWYITGVQLEAGSTATPFEFRSIGTELALCQRYYEQSNPTVAASGLYALDSGSYHASWNYSGASGIAGSTPFKVIKRATPTVIAYTTAQGSSSTANKISHFQGSWTNYNNAIPLVDVSSFSVSYSGGSTGSALTQYNWTASAEL